MIKVLIVDDAISARGVLKQIIAKGQNLEIVGEAQNGIEAIAKTKTEKPDVIIMDINMPEMDGLEATKVIMKECPTSILIFTTLDVAEVSYSAIEAGAVDILPKPNFSQLDSRFISLFIQKIESAAKANISRKPVSTVSVEPIEMINKKFKIVCIGTSTGGPFAVQTILRNLPATFPLPILITQHIEIGFDTHYVSWLSSFSKLPVSLAEDGKIPQPGHVYVAPADRHLIVTSSVGGTGFMSLSDEPPLFFLRPAVDMLFTTAANVYKDECLAILLTGMGKDGCDGAKEVHDKGGFVICESEESCIVYGMSRAAIEAGAASRILPLDKIAKLLMSFTKK